MSREKNTWIVFQVVNKYEIPWNIRKLQNTSQENRWEIYFPLGHGKLIFRIPNMVKQQQRETQYNHGKTWGARSNFDPEYRNKLPIKNSRDLKFSLRIWCLFNFLIIRNATVANSFLNNHTMQAAPTSQYTLFFISNTFISNARMKFANFQNLSRKILRTELWNLCEMIALSLNSILNTFLSGRVRPIFGKFEFR